MMLWRTLDFEHPKGLWNMGFMHRRMSWTPLGLWTFKTFLSIWPGFSRQQICCHPMAVHWTLGPPWSHRCCFHHCLFQAFWLQVGSTGMMYSSQTATTSTYFCARNSNGSRMIYNPFAAAMQGEKDCQSSALFFWLQNTLKLQFMCFSDHMSFLERKIKFRVWILIH